mmetsp:Transcript_75758/g.214153  ORF Transcript_75758/g.214153 Transcript_75758/m.214153 type:complete len:1054 (+) Transcript_75758:51-3212(+)
MLFGRGQEQTLSSFPPENVRNLCILAHVDHGKTTCADNLISSNGIISYQSAGKIRYMDSRVDEQERQITMKSSSIALRWVSPSDKGTYLVNLIDSPGHVDFTSEVSTAARLADGALIVVDVLEGVAAQTRTVLRQAWRDRVQTCLLLNKVDRLVIELELTPLEAYHRLVRILEQINVANQQLLFEEIMAKDEPAAAAGELGAGSDGIDLTAALEYDEVAEKAMCYSPERGNVMFGSAAHGWAFRIDTFAKMIAAKIGANPSNLQKVLWGDWVFNKKTKRAQRWHSSDTKTKPMFVEFILKQIFTVYDVAYKELNLEHLEKMRSQIPAWEQIDLRKLSAGSAAVRDLLARWLPFSDCALRMATEHMPSPIAAAACRLPVLCPRWFAAGSSAGSSAASAPIAEGLRRSDPAGPTVAYVAKFFVADLERKVLTGDSPTGDEDVKFIGICRVFSGTLRLGQELYVAGEEGPGDARQQGHRVLRVGRLFVLMGRFLEEIPDAPSGSIVAVYFEAVGGADAQESARGSVELGVERYLTLCDAADGPCLETPYSTQAFAIVRVSIEPQNIADLDALDRGLRLLHKADPSVLVQAMVTGENVLGCCGDEHLKRCINDLQKLYAQGVPLRISDPLVTVRESIAGSISAERTDAKTSPMYLPSWVSHLADAAAEASSVFSAPASEPEEAPEAAAKPVKERVSMSRAGVMSVWTSNRRLCLRVSALALPDEVLAWMDDHADEFECVIHRQRASVALSGGNEATLDECLAQISQQFERKVRGAGDDEGAAPGVLCGMSVTKGSRTVLLDATGSSWTLRDSYHCTSAASDAAREQSQNGSAECVQRWMWPSVLAGFQLASSAGPLCEEPMRGVMFVLQGCQVDSTEDAHDAVSSEVASVGMSGQVMMAMKEACRYGLFRRGFARICEAMLSVDIQCEQVTLGKVYAVIGKRHGKVLDEGLREGTSMFCISAFLPLAESFGLAHDLRTAASGHVSFHCAFSHWEQSEEDPFQEASLTAEELEELGEKPMLSNHARKLVDAIRKRKGLPTDEKVVNSATKLRTLTKNK